jgi:hypothetical protein
MITGSTIKVEDLMATIASAAGAVVTIGCDGLSIEIIHTSTSTQVDGCGRKSSTILWKGTQVRVDSSKINDIVAYLYANTCVRLNFVADIDNPDANADLTSLANGAAQVIDRFTPQIKQAIYDVVIAGFTP